ncbi:MAG: hypothetical protein ABIU95_14590, partial [Burkholderiales bacterium]
MRPRSLSLALCGALAVNLATAQQTAAPAAPTKSAAAAAESANVTRSAAWWTDASRMLAGLDMNAGSELAALAKRPSVDQHRKAFG